VTEDFSLKRKKVEELKRGERVQEKNQNSNNRGGRGNWKGVIFNDIFF